MSLREAGFEAKLRTVKRDARTLYAELLRNERLPVDELARLTSQRAATIAAHAYDHSPFYRERYEAAGLDRDALRDPAAWPRLPVVDRASIKGETQRIRTPGVPDRDARPALTGGSTGEPLRTWNDARVPLQALSWRLYRWWGVEPWDDVVHIGRWAASRKERWKTALTWWPTRVGLVDASHLDPAAVADLVAGLRRHRPALVEGYVGALVELARHVERGGASVPPPRALGATAAPLTDEVRAYVQQVLGAPLHDQYRCSEVPWMAGECAERNGLHVFSDMRLIEVVDEHDVVQPPGVVGDLVVTDLANRVFPLVRYRLGDRGSLRAEPCPCGVTLPLMDPPDGRTVDMIRLPDGTVVAGGLFSIFSRVPTAVRQFTLHQNVDHSIDVTAVPGESGTARADAERALDALRDRLGRQVEVRLTTVAELPYRGGKLKYVTSDVQPPR